MQLNKPKLWLFLALGLGWLTDWLFYGKGVGVSLLLFVLCLLGGLSVLTIVEGRPWRGRNLWLIGPLLFFATMGMVRVNPFLTFLNVSVVLLLLALLAYFYTADQIARPGLVEYALLPLRVFGGMVARPWPVVRETVDVSAVRVHGGGSVVPIVRGMVLASPVLLVFGLLLASADVIFANSVRSVLAFDFGFSPLEVMWRGVLIVLVGWLLGGGMLVALRRSTAVKASLPEKIMLGLADRLPLGLIEAGTILTLINLLFGAFVSIQFAYLFGGLQHIELEGFTYSEYARRGYFELITVAVLTLGLILVLNWFTRRNNRQQMVVFNVLGSIMIGFVLVMLASAFKRMNLYEWVYGFTELRLYVYVSMGWLALVLIWFVVTLWLRPDRFAVGVLIAGLGFVATLNVINPDAFIVRQNVVRYEQSGYLDVQYLGTLSDDAVPELIEITALVAEVDTVTAVDCGRGYSSRVAVETLSETPSTNCLQMTDPSYLHDNLRGRLARLTADEQLWQWQAWHLGRMQAYEALQMWE